MAQVCAKTCKKLVELASFTESEPGNIYVYYMKKFKNIANSKIKDFVNICSRPILDTEVWKATEQKLKEEGVKIKMGEPGQFYDPLSPASELTIFTQQIKRYEQVKESKRKHFWEIMMGSVFGMLLGAGAAKVAKTSFAVEIVKMYFMTVATLKIIGEIAAYNTTMRFVHAEVGRLRFAATSGNLVQLLMRIEEKCNYMERRSMEFFAHSGDFYRMLREKVTLEIWNSKEAGREKFGYMVQSFLAEKTVRKGPCSSKEKFIADLKEFLEHEAQMQIDSKKDAKVANGKFLQQLSADLDKIAEDFNWFAEDIVWQS